ncbi:MAG: hypothetical protein ACXWZF_13810 [Actinomycetota bacterium]
MTDLIDRLHRDLDDVAVGPAPFDDLGNRVARRERRRKAGAGVMGAALALVVIAGAWTAAERRDERSVPPVTPVAVATADRLFLAGDGEAWVVDPASLTVRHLSMPQLPPGDALHRVVRRGEVLVAWAYETLLLDPNDPTKTRVLVPDSLYFIPSSAPDRVWVAIADEARDDGRLSAVREVATDGEITVPDTLPPDGAWPIAAVGRNLVFQRDNELIVWDPASGREVGRLEGGFQIAWQGDLLASCGGRCSELLVTDVADGGELTISPPAGAAGFEAFQGAFSPDGTTLAVAAILGEDPDADRRLALIDLDTGRIELVDGATVATPYVFIDWAPSGDTVFIAGGQDADHRQLVAYRIGDPRATVVDVRVGDFYGMAAFQVEP